MAATIKIPTVFTAVDKFSSVVKKMTGGVKKFGKTGSAAIKRFDNKLTNSVKKIGKVGALVGGLALGTLFSSAIQGNIAFNDSLASVSAITGATGDDLAKLEKLAISTAKETKKSGADVLKAYELVGSAQPILLQNADALDGVTRSVITLSKASRMDLEQSTLALTDVMNQFNLTGKDSAKTIDILAAGAKFGAAAIPQISEAIVQFGTVAKQSNVSLQESVAAIEVFASKGIKGAEAGTKMRNVLTTLATAKALPKKALDELKKFGVNLDVVTDNTIPLSARLKEFSKIGGDATAMVKVFGKENQGAGAILLNNIDQFKELTKQVSESGVAQTQATANTNTLSFALESIKTSFTNATTATNSGSKSLDAVKKVLTFVADNMNTLIGVAGVLLGAFVAMKAIIIANTIATTAYNIAIGVMGATQGTASIAIGQSTVALGAYKVVTAITAAVQWVLASAVWATLAPILAVIAAIVAIILIFKNWGAITDWFSEKWSQFTAFISDAWTGVIEWFQNFSFKEFFMDIGKSIMKFMLLPLKSVLKLIRMLPGEDIGIVTDGLKFIDDIEGSINGLGEKKEVLPSTAQKGAEITKNSVTQNNLAIDINDPGSNIAGVTQNGSTDIPINLSNTQGKL